MKSELNIKPNIFNRKRTLTSEERIKLELELKKGVGELKNLKSIKMARIKKENILNKDIKLKKRRDRLRVNTQH